MQIVNYHALAEKIIPEVKRYAGNDVKINSVVATLNRISRNLSKAEERQVVSLLKDSKLKIESNVAEVTIAPKNVSLQETLERLAQISEKLSPYPNLFQFENYLKLIVDEHDLSVLEEEFGKNSAIQINSGIAKILLELPRGKERIPGITSFLTSLLYRYGVNIISCYLSYDGMIIIVDEESAPTAYRVIGEII